MKPTLEVFEVDTDAYPFGMDVTVGMEVDCDACFFECLTLYEY